MKFVTLLHGIFVCYHSKVYKLGYFITWYFSNNCAPNFCRWNQRKMLGSQSSAERESSRLQSPLPSASSHGRGKENDGGEGVSIVPSLRKNAARLCQVAIKTNNCTVNYVNRVKGYDRCSPLWHRIVDSSWFILQYILGVHWAKMKDCKISEIVCNFP